VQYHDLDNGMPGQAPSPLTPCRPVVGTGIDKRAHAHPSAPEPVPLMWGTFDVQPETLMVQRPTPARTRVLQMAAMQDAHAYVSQTLHDILFCVTQKTNLVIRRCFPTAPNIHRAICRILISLRLTAMLRRGGRI